MQRIKYDTTKYPFKEIFIDFLGTRNLSKLHLSNDFEKVDLLTREKDQSTIYHRKYYDNFHLIEPVYKSFISDVIKPLFGGSDIVYQRIPTIRYQFPNNIAVGEWHKDKWYRDSQWHEAVKERNYYLPFTNAYDTNTIWVESEEDKGDYYPLDCKYGEVIEWDGVNLTHGNKQNISDDTRISVDFRVMSLDTYRPSNKGAINTKTEFKIGGYYDLI